MAPSDAEDYRKTFGTMQENITNFLVQVNLPDLEVQQDTVGFDPNLYWENLTKIADKLGFESNKITIMWINKPEPSNRDMIAVCGSLELTCVSLLKSLLYFPSTQGLTLRKRLRNAILDLLENCVKFTTVLLNSVGSKYTNENHPLVSECGQVMQSCELLKKLPRENRLAAAEALLAEANIIKDALRELEEARSCEGFMDEFECNETWSESDKIIINPLLGMIKTSGALTKKTMDSLKKNLTKVEDIPTLDRISEHFARISPHVDDLALTIYPPMNWTETKLQAWKLKETLEDILCYLTVVLQDAENLQWLEFIKKAVAHNAAEIQRIFIQHGLAELSLS